MTVHSEHLNIGLYDIDSKIANLALMKISTYHKNKGNTVRIFRKAGLFNKQFDKIYASSVFTYSNKSYITDDMICGGSGFNLTTVLPQEIDDCDPDYSIYPDSDYSIQFFSRGCNNNCEFCIVKEKEGYMETVEPMKLNPKGKWIKVFDNNFFANPEWRSGIKQLKKWGLPVTFYGIDARTLTKENANALLSLKSHNQFKMAWDDPRENINWKQIIKWIPAHKIMVYILTGYWSTLEEDLYRVEKLRKLRIDSFVQIYRDQYNLFPPTEISKHFARWVNHKAIFKSVKWEDYLRNNK